MWTPHDSTLGEVARSLAGIADDLVDARRGAESLGAQVQWACAAALRFRASARSLEEEVRSLGDDVEGLRSAALLRAAMQVYP